MDEQQPRGSRHRGAVAGIRPENVGSDPTGSGVGHHIPAGRNAPGRDGWGKAACEPSGNVLTVACPDAPIVDVDPRVRTSQGWSQPTVAASSAVLFVLLRHIAELLNPHRPMSAGTPSRSHWNPCTTERFPSCTSVGRMTWPTPWPAMIVM